MGMEARAGSLTVAGLVGTGLATIGFALSGVSALGDDLTTAAREARPAPVLSPGEESRTAPPAAVSPSEALTFEQVCDREKRERDAAQATTPPTKPARDAAALRSKEL